MCSLECLLYIGHTICSLCKVLCMKVLVSYIYNSMGHCTLGTRVIVRLAVQIF